MTHESKIKDQAAKLEEQDTIVTNLKQEVERLNRKVRGLESTVNQLLSVIKRRG